MSERAKKVITTLTGENDYMITKFVRQQQVHYLDKYGQFGVEKIDCEEVETERILEALQSLPFLAPEKLVILRKPGQNKKFVDMFTDILETIPQSVTVIIIETKPDKRSTYYKTLKSKTELKEFPVLDNNMLAKWLVSEAKDRGGEISLSDAIFLLNRVGNNQMLLSNDLDKLITYSPKINRDNINKLTIESPQTTIFDLIEASLQGRTKKALEIYEQQRQQKVEPQQIVAMLAWQLHIMATVKSAGQKSSSQIASDAKINPYVVGKSQKLVGEMTYSEIKQHIHDLFELDYQLKTSAIDADLALQGYIMGLQKIPRD